MRATFSTVIGLNASLHTLKEMKCGAPIHLVAFHNVFVGNLVSGISVHLHVRDAVAGVSVDLVETDFLGIGSGRIQSDRTSNE